MPDITVKPVSEADLPANHRSFYKKAIDAVRAKNTDYAIQLLLPVLLEHPGFLSGRRLIRKAEAIKNGPPKKMSMKLLVGFKSKIHKDPLAAIHELEEKVFTTEPFHIEGNDMLYEAALAVGDLELASFALKTTTEGHPEHTKSMHKLGEHFMANGLADKAVEVYQDILKLTPNDGAANRGLTNSQAQATLDSKNWGTQGDVRELLKDQEETDGLELEARSGMTRDQLELLLSRWSAKYEEDPNNVQIVRKVADVCAKLKDYATAAQYLEWATTLNTADVTLKNQAAEMRNRVVEQRIEVLEKEIQAEPDGDDVRVKKKQLEELRLSGADERIANAKKIVEGNPTDPGARFILGTEYFHAGKHSEAIPELQRAKNNPGFRVKALTLLGKCYQEKKLHDMALNHFEDALKETLGMDDAKKSLLYDLSVLCEESGHKEKSLGYLKQIYEADYSFRDVAARVEAAYAG
jgi:tetratricopeptide (TPR) repeat protein